MAGQEDWEQLQLGDGAQGYASVWIHKPCGQVIGMAYTNVHESFCPAKAE